jgi:hypothetical protein
MSRVCICVCVSSMIYRHVNRYEIPYRYKQKVKRTLVQALRLCTGRTAHGGVEYSSALS